MGKYTPKKIPVSEGQELNVTIEALGEKGDGIVKIQGFTLIVPGTTIGQRCDIRINRVLLSYGFAEVI